MTLDLGVYSFGNTPRTAGGGTNTAQAIRDVLEAVHVAEQAGLDFFGFGEHHTASMPLSSPTSLVNAAAATTRRMRMFAASAEAGRAPMAPSGREADYERGAMVFAGGPNEIADRILGLHQLLGHSRQILQMDVGGMAHATFLKSIELLGAEVLPQVRKELENQATVRTPP
jgi:alkanesulfonate monooxygenase SsuD/methylene tetrahydromethanopterin reductase-like flavin-dependent oxidoreductase (luciferase family)